MVNHIVVHLVNSLAVVGLIQHLQDPLLIGLRMEDGGGPAGQTGQIETLGMEGAIQLAVLAALRCAFGAVFCLEVVQRTEGVQLYALLTCQPQQMDLYL